MQTNNSVEKTRLKQLDGLRLLFIFMIILSHSVGFTYSYGYKDFFYKYFMAANLGVNYFFLSSGFMLYITNYNKKLKIDVISCIMFAINKIKKIYPLYIISTIMMLFIYLLLSQQYGDMLISLIIHIMLIQSWLGVSKYIGILNQVSWFLSALFFIYILSPIMIDFLQKHFRNWLRLIILFVFVLVMIALTQNLWIYLDKNPNIIFDSLSYSSPLSRVLVVFLGMILGKIYLATQGIKKYKTILSILEILLYIGIIIYWLLIKVKGFYFIYDLVLLSLLLIVFAYGKGIVSEILKCKVFSIPGKNVMYLFLLHYPVIRFLYMINIKPYTWGNKTGIIEIVLVFLITGLVSFITYKLLEYRKSAKTTN